MANNQESPGKPQKRKLLLKGVALLGVGAAISPSEWVSPIVSTVIDQAEATCGGVATPPFSPNCGGGGGNPPPAPPPSHDEFEEIL